MVVPTTPATPLYDAHQAGFLFERISGFTKPALNVNQMIDNLKSHNMVFSDEEAAKIALLTINYYRLSTYWFPFKIESGDGHYRFIENLDFSTILRHHEFDQTLRHKVMHGVEIIEIALRRALASELSLRNGAFAHQKSELYLNITLWEKHVIRFKKDFDESKEEFANHFRIKYSNLQLPPIWVSLEMSSFGVLSQFYSNIKDNQVRSAISQIFGLDEEVLISFLRHLTSVRNLCAHHARLWNRKFVIKPKLPRRIPSTYKDMFNGSKVGSRQLFNTLVIMDFVISNLQPSFHFLNECEEIFSKYPEINTLYMGKLKSVSEAQGAGNSLNL